MKVLRIEFDPRSFDNSLIKLLEIIKEKYKLKKINLTNLYIGRMSNNAELHFIEIHL